jgi:hypothetical protein
MFWLSLLIGAIRVNVRGILSGVIRPGLPVWGNPSGGAWLALRVGRSIRSHDQIPHLESLVLVEKWAEGGAMACAGKTWLVSSSLLREEAAEVRGKKNLSFPASGVDLHVSKPGAETGRRKDEAGSPGTRTSTQIVSIFGAGWFTAPLASEPKLTAIAQKGRIGQRRGVARPARAILHTRCLLPQASSAIDVKQSP